MKDWAKATTSELVTEVVKVVLTDLRYSTSPSIDFSKAAKELDRRIPCPSG